MIKKKCFSKEWIYSFRDQKKFRKLDYVSLEKMILALSLVEQLELQNLNFIFKGGTSLALHFNEPKRFSIDVDILTSENKKSIDKTLEQICADSPFVKFKLDERRSFNSPIPKAHYKLHFVSNIDGTENYILLDVLFEKNLYPTTQDVEVKNVFLETEGKPTIVNVPTIDSITGDKLTAFAPHTIGIKFGIDKDLEIIKQLFDLNYLFDNIKDFRTTFEAYRNFSKQEISYRNLKCGIEETLKDTLETSLTIAKRNKNKGQQLDEFKSLQMGLIKLPSYLVTVSFTLDAAIEAAAKVALLSAKLLKQNFLAIEKFDKSEGIQKYFIKQTDYNFLNKLAKLPNSSLYYWHQAINILNN